MNTSARGPRRGGQGAFMMRLERVCKFIEKGAEVTVEFHPCSDIVPMLGDTMEHVRLRIHEGGDVSVHGRNDVAFTLLGLTLANYNRLWRCWQNGKPTLPQRRGTRWG